MKKTQSIFFRNIASIDFAEIDRHRLIPHGGSYQVNMVLSGQVDDMDPIMFDFLAIQKTVTCLLEDKQSGYDHKLWIPADIQTSSLFIEEDSGEIQISTPFFECICPTLSTQFITKNHAEDINRYISNSLRSKYPLMAIKTEIELSKSADLAQAPAYSRIDFRFIHGVRNSVHPGCRNMNHGHSSWVVFANNDNNPVLFPFVQSCRIRDNLNDSIFVSEENVCSIKNGFIEVEYTTPEGLYHSRYAKDYNKVVIIPEEPFIDNLNDWFVKKYYEVMIEYGVKTVYMSQGLSKGSVITI